MQYAFGEEGNPTLGVPPGASVEYEAELRNFEKAKESWEMDQAEKIEQAKACKERGTQFLKEEKYKLAVKQYKKIIDLLEYDSGKLCSTCLAACLMLHPGCLLCPPHCLLGVLKGLVVLIILLKGNSWGLVIVIGSGGEGIFLIIQGF